MKLIRGMVCRFRNLLRNNYTKILPTNSIDKYGFAFLVHARNIDDIYRKYPLLKIFPNSAVNFAAKHMWPVVVSEVTGLRSLKNGKEVKGVIVGIPMTASQMMADRKMALKKIIDSSKLAKKLGAGIVGLGGLTSSLSKGGLDLVNEVDINITTGHAYTAYTVSENVFRIVKTFNLDKNAITVAIVGASGSIGSTVAELIAQEKFKNIILLDVSRKISTLDNLSEKLQTLNMNIKLSVTSDMSSLVEADIVVTATNTPEAVVISDYLKKGAIIIDDAQPSDVAFEVLDNDDVLVIEAGIVHTPDIDNHFNFGLKDKYDNFCCMCEIMILAANEWNEHYVVNRANLSTIKNIVELSQGLNFRLAELQNFKESISKEKVEQMKKILNA